MKEKKWLITKSNDGCVIIIKAKKKTHQNDFFLSQATLDRNLEEKTFVKHENLDYEGNPLYVYAIDI